MPLLLKVALHVICIKPFAFKTSEVDAIKISNLAISNALHPDLAFFYRSNLSYCPGVFKRDWFTLSIASLVMGSRTSKMEERCSVPVQIFINAASENGLEASTDLIKRQIWQRQPENIFQKCWVNIGVTEQEEASLQCCSIQSSRKCDFFERIGVVWRQRFRTK